MSQPTTTAQATHELIVQDIRQGRRPKPLIICVDDEKNVLDALEELLHPSLGELFEIDIAESAEECQEVIRLAQERNKPVAVVISDQLMPGMKGDDFLVELHRQLPDTLKIMLTGQANAENVGKVVNEAALYRYIAKPWDNTDFRMTIEQAAWKYLDRETIDDQAHTLRLLHNASHVLSRKLDTQELLAELMPLVQEFSGAETAWLAVPQQGEWKALAQVSCGQAPQVGLSYSLQDTDRWPAQAVEQVVQSRKLLLLAAEQLAGQSWPYLQQHPQQALLAHPITNHGRLTAVLVLAHSSLPAAFTPERRDYLTILATQGGIALDNSQLLNHMEEQVLDRTRQVMAVSSHKEEMVRMVSHDLRSPLSGIGNLAELLRGGDIDQEQVEQFGGIIAKSVSNLLKLVNDLLDTARLESGQILLNRRDIQLQELVQNVVKNHEAVALTKNLQLAAEVQEDLLLHVDPAQLSQALGNLVANALKFTPEGGAVTLQARPETVGGERGVQIAVQDTGTGIAQEDLPRLFEKFGRYQRAGTKGEKGSGLGLTLAKELIELHGGFIQVASEPGQGTTFTVSLPAEAPETTREPVAA